MKYNEKDVSSAIKNEGDKKMGKMAAGFTAVTPEKFGGKEPSSGYLPSFSLPLKNIPEAKDWEVGNEYTLTIRVKQTGMTERDGEDPRVDFEVRGIKADKSAEDDE